MIAGSCRRPSTVKPSAVQSARDLAPGGEQDRVRRPVRDEQLDRPRRLRPRQVPAVLRLRPAGGVEGLGGGLEVARDRRARARVERPTTTAGSSPSARVGGRRRRRPPTIRVAVDRLEQRHAGPRIDERSGSVGRRLRSDRGEGRRRVAERPRRRARVGEGRRRRPGRARTPRRGRRSRKAVGERVRVVDRSGTRGGVEAGRPARARRVGPGVASGSRRRRGAAPGRRAAGAGHRGRRLEDGVVAVELVDDERARSRSAARPNGRVGHRPDRRVARGGGAERSAGSRARGSRRSASRA